MLKVGFTGDVSFTGVFSKAFSGDENHIDPQIMAFLEENHYNVFNIEGPLTEKPFMPKVGVSLNSNVCHIDILKSLKCNVFNLANNHIMDCGHDGLLDTMAIADQNSILHFGAGEDLQRAAKPLILEEGGVRVALLAICHPEGTLAELSSPGILADNESDIIKETINRLKKENDWVVVNSGLLTWAAN